MSNTSSLRSYTSTRKCSRLFRETAEVIHDIYKSATRHILGQEADTERTRVIQVI